MLKVYVGLTDIWKSVEENVMPRFGATLRLPERLKSPLMNPAELV